MMNRPKRPAVEFHQGDAAFGLSFSSLIIILLTFFVYLDANRQPNAIRESNVFASLNERFAQRSKALPHLSSTAALRTSTIINTAESAGFEALRTGDKFIITLPSARTFASGDDELLSDAVPAILRIAQIARVMKFAVSIEGHTDDRPIATARFASNWELSAARAIAVLKVFLSSGIPPSRISAAGRGQFLPIASNETEEGRARNRRVTLILEGRE